MTATTTAADKTTVSTTYAYVPAGKPGAGLVQSLKDASGTITYGYDADRHRTSVTYPDGSKVSAVYSDNGFLDTTTDVTGAVTKYLYNPDTTLKSATQTRGTSTLATVGYTYDGLGRVSTITRGNGLTTKHTYTPANLLATQVTTDSHNVQVEARSYSYDTHHNLTRKIETTPPPSTCTVVCSASANTFGTWTTTYTYDAYDRLIGSAVYPGSITTAPTSVPTTQLSYALDGSGNITTTTRTTRTSGTRPTVTTQTTINQLDAAGQLTQRTVGSTATAQTHDSDGRVVTALSGAKTTYRPDGLPATVTTAKGVTTTFSYWPDGTRRRASTVDPANGTTTVDLHYGVDGNLSNDTTTQAGGSASASYLISHGREARTLQSVSTATGRIKATSAPSVTTGTGVGYLLRDRHSSVTAIADSQGAVTNTYAYGDYGAPELLDGRPGTLVGAASGTNPGQANPLQYAGGGVQTMFSDSALGTLMTPARFYDPSQGRFLARDTANVHNRYAAFGANPIMNVDPTGQTPTADLIIDALYVVVFAVSAIITLGVSVPAAAAALTAVAAEEVTAALVIPVVAETASALANTSGFVFDGARLVDDVSRAAGNGQLLSDDERNDLNNASTVAGSIAGAAGMAASAAEGVTAAAAEAAADHAVPTDPTVKVNGGGDAGGDARVPGTKIEEIPGTKIGDKNPLNGPRPRRVTVDESSSNLLLFEESDPKQVVLNDKTKVPSDQPPTIRKTSSATSSEDSTSPLLNDTLDVASKTNLALNVSNSELKETLERQEPPNIPSPNQLRPDPTNVNGEASELQPLIILSQDHFNAPAACTPLCGRIWNK